MKEKMNKILKGRKRKWKERPRVLVSTFWFQNVLQMLHGCLCVGVKLSLLEGSGSDPVLGAFPSGFCIFSLFCCCGSPPCTLDSSHTPKNCRGASGSSQSAQSRSMFPIRREFFLTLLEETLAFSQALRHNLDE